MPNEMFQTRLPDTFAERIHEYADDHGMTKSEAMRSLLRKGLAEENYPIPATDGGGERIWKEWLAWRLGVWADRSAYAALASIMLALGLSAPVYFNVVDPTVPIAVGYIFSITFAGIFGAGAGVLSIASLGLMIRAGADLKDALPWRTPA